MVVGLERSDHTRYFAPMSEASPFDSVDLDAKRAGTQGKWVRYDPDVLPAWVAEHDFDRPPQVAEALHRVADLGGWGYCNTEPEVAESFASWADRRYGWPVDPELVTLTIDSLQGVWAAVSMLTEPGDGVIITPPVYFPFFWIADTLQRRQLEWRLRRSDDGWNPNLDDFRALLEAEPSAKVLVLCHPHNPTGRVMPKEWLTELVAVAAEYDVFIVSDEIHADLVYPGAEYVPLLTVPGAAERTVVATSTGKTFAMSGLRCAVSVAGNPAMKERWDDAHSGLLLGRPNRPGMAACMAAWDHGAHWTDELVAYLDGNRKHLGDRLAAEAPAVLFHLPESTYLAWLDVSAVGLGDEPSKALLKQAKVALSEGSTFGAGGEGHVRLNFGTSRAVLDQIIDRLIPHLQA